MENAAILTPTSGFLKSSYTAQSPPTKDVPLRDRCAGPIVAQHDHWITKGLAAMDLMLWAAICQHGTSTWNQWKRYQSWPDDGDFTRCPLYV